MRFSEYMRQWLYGEEGYYSHYRPIGKKGDFFTAVSTSKFFGGSIAKHIITQVDKGLLDENSLICEIGAHHGYLLADIIEFIHTLRPTLLTTLRFAIIERHSALQQAQKNYFEESFGTVVALEHYYSLSELNEQCTFFVANEIFDAFECELVYGGKIARVDNHKIYFDIDDPLIVQKAISYKQDKGEVALNYEKFAEEMAKSSTRFEFMTFDYGELEARSDFSIRIYDKHQTYPLFDESLNLEEVFGKTDITYDVNFSQVKEAFLSAGVECVEYSTQLVALVQMGILELLATLQENASEQIYKQELEKIKILITPSLMGERFKMIRFYKS